MQFYAKVCVRCDSIRTKLSRRLVFNARRNNDEGEEDSEREREIESKSKSKRERERETEQEREKKRKKYGSLFVVRCYGFCVCLQNILKLQKDFKTISCTYCLRSFLPSRHFFFYRSQQQQRQLFVSMCWKSVWVIFRGKATRLLFIPLLDDSRTQC